MQDIKISSSSRPVTSPCPPPKSSDASTGISLTYKAGNTSGTLPESSFIRNSGTTQLKPQSATLQGQDKPKTKNWFSLFFSRLTFRSHKPTTLQHATSPFPPAYKTSGAPNSRQNRQLINEERANRFYEKHTAKTQFHSGPQHFSVNKSEEKERMKPANRAPNSRQNLKLINEELANHFYEKHPGKTQFHSGPQHFSVNKSEEKEGMKPANINQQMTEACIDIYNRYVNLFPDQFAKIKNYNSGNRLADITCALADFHKMLVQAGSYLAKNDINPLSRNVTHLLDMKDVALHKKTVHATLFAARSILNDNVKTQETLLAQLKAQCAINPEFNKVYTKIANNQRR